MKKIISMIFSFVMLFPSYLFSVLPSKAETDFAILPLEIADVTGIENGVITEKAVLGEDAEIEKE